MCTICQSLRPYKSDCDYQGLNDVPLMAEVTESTDAPDVRTSTYTIDADDTFQGYYNQAGDNDVIALNVTAGTTYTVSLNGGATSSGVPDTMLTVLDASGTLIVSDDDGGPGLNSRATFTASTTGVVYLSVGQYAATAVPGSYSLSVAISPLNTPVATPQDMANHLISDFWADPPPTGYTGSPRHFAVSPGGTLYVDVLGLTSDGQRLALDALSAWTAASGINFSTSVPSGVSAHIVFDDYDAGAYATTTFIDSTTTSAFVNVSTDWLITEGTGLSSYSFQTYVHEIGHALGLGHAGFYNGSANYGEDNRFANDSWQLTVMSYFDQQNNTFINSTYAIVLTPMIADLVAIQSLYGTATTLRTGNTTYGENSTAGGVFDQFSVINNDGNLSDTVAMTIIDNGGTDTLDFRSDVTAQRIDLREGRVSDLYGHTGTLSIALGTVIENVMAGSGADILIGNSANNLIQSFAGADEADGGDGSDTIDGGLGNDTLRGGNGFDTLNGEAGNDSIWGGNQADAIYGGDNADALHGEQGFDIVSGGAGNDLLYGGTEQDWMFGGIDNDTVYGGAGTDFLFGGLGFDTIYGEADNDRLTGEGQADALYGGDGNDTLLGEQGFDVVSGNAGNDSLYGGTDQDWMFGGIDNDMVDGGTGNDFLYGGLGFDTIFGGDGNDRILGEGNADMIYGGIGNDTMTGGDGVDRFVFTAGSGNDTITDYNPTAAGEAIMLNGIAGLTTFGAVQSAMTTIGANTTINLGGGNSITLINVQSAALTADDFIFA